MRSNIELKQTINKYWTCKMKLRHSVLLKLTTLLLLVCSWGISFANVTEGQVIALPQLVDQFEQTQTLRPSTKWLLFAHDMDGTNVVRDALEGQTTASLANAGIQFFADISGMPSLISKFIAMPRLKKLEYPIGLARTKESLEQIPREDEKATVIKLSEGKVASVITTDSSATIKQLLAL